MKRTALQEITWSPTRCVIPGLHAYASSTGASLIHSIEHGRHHVSVSAKGRYPSWDELASARDRVARNVPMMMLFPTEDEYVNVHETCLHLWEVEQ